MSTTQTCEACGAVVHAEHIDQGRAGRWAGQLLCPACYAEKRSAIEGVGAAPAAPAAGPSLDSGPVAVEPVADTPDPADEPISLVESDDDGGRTSGREQVSTKIRNISQASSGAVRHREDFNRQPAVTGAGICRVRTFHAKIQQESLDFMDNVINEWLDENPDIEVKHVTATIGTLAGKHPEPNLILNIWY